RRELGKLLEVGSHDLVRVLALEAGKAILDVGRVVRPALLAVVDDVDAGRHLRPDGIVYRRSRPRGERLGRRPGRVVLPEECHQVVRSRKAPDVRREDPHRPRTFPQSVIFPLKSAHPGYFMNSSGVQVQNWETLG